MTKEKRLKKTFSQKSQQGKLSSLFGSSLLLLLPLGAIASMDYTVKPGDTFSHIALKHMKGVKLYGKDGRVSKLQKLNTQINNPNLIEVGQIIHLSKKLTAEIQKKKDLEKAKNIAEGKDQISTLQAAPQRTYSIFENPLERTNKKLQVTVSTSVTASNLDLVDAQANKSTTFATDPGLGVQAKLQYLTGKRLSYELKAGIKTLNYKFKGGGDAGASGKQFGELGANVNYLVGNSVRIKGGVLAADRAYAVSKGGLRILKKNLISPEMGLTLKLDETKKSVSNMSVLFTLLPETTIGGENVKSGINTRAALGFQWTHMNVQPFLNWSNQDIETRSQQILDLGFNLGYRF